MHPSLVLLADRTAAVKNQKNRSFTNAQWQTGEEQTIAALKSKTTTVAVIGDITALSQTPPECLATYPTNIQKCSVKNPNPKMNQHLSAERAAAKAEDIVYLNPEPWFCNSTCSPVIGNMVVYFNEYHVTATYAGYLSTIFGNALKPLL
jgi:hypothetical protein